MKGLFLLSAFLCGQFVYAQLTLPHANIRGDIVRLLASEMERLDGEALYLRKNRQASWQQITDQLAIEAEQAITLNDFARVFSRLNQSYPNLHASLNIGKELESALIKGTELKVYFMAEILSERQTQYVISNIHKDAVYSKETQPELGDELLAINGQAMADWEKETLEFCKFPLAYQCNRELPRYFEKEFLSWRNTQPLFFTLRRGSKVWDILVETRPKAAGTRNQVDCKIENNRHQGFKRIYSGNRACVYQSINDPKTALLRITSFDYSGLNKNESITSLPIEVNQLYSWWVNNSDWDHMIIDLIDNTGGNAPTEYHEILLKKPFQQLYVTYKKTKELENSYLRSQVLWETTEQELWFQSLIGSGDWENLNYGDYTPAVPMFCAEPNQDCRKGLFKPRPHSFNGKISLLMNQWCVSACDDFVYVLTEQLGSRVKTYGQHQAADTAYSRLAIQVDLDSTQPKGFTLKVVSSHGPPSPEAFFTQTVVLSRAQDGRGNILSGIPVELTEFVPLTFNNYKNWPNTVLEKALEK